MKVNRTVVFVEADSRLSVTTQMLDVGATIHGEAVSISIRNMDAWHKLNIAMNQAKKIILDNTEERESAAIEAQKEAIEG